MATREVTKIRRNSVGQGDSLDAGAGRDERATAADSLNESQLSLPRVAVLGAGLMGHGIAQVFAVAGAAVTIWDPDAEVLAAAPGRIAKNLAQLGMGESAAEVTLASAVEAAVQNVDLVCEAAPEDMTIKRDLVRQVEEFNASCIFGTNTSVLQISEIAGESRRPDQIVGMHWWNPPFLIPIVEVVPGRSTSQNTLDAVHRWLEAVGKTPVAVLKDAPGFVGNRMQFALLREAAHIVEQGIATAETVDIVARNTFGRRWAAVGPFENADYIGLDLVDAIMSYLLPTLSATTETSALMRQRIDEGLLGAKSGGGIFNWPDGKRAQTSDRLLEHLLRQTGME